MTSRAWARTLPLLLPLVLVNTAAVYGQAGWAYDHLIHRWLIAGLFAAAVESIGVYLAFEAHAALMAGDASARLRAGSYLIGLLAGALNYAHFAGAGYAPTPLAVTFAALSSISPWLWAIRSRSMNRARLRELGQIDPRAVRFSLLRWLLFPVRTIKAFRVAVWHGIVAPAEAVARSGVKAPGLPAQRADSVPPVHVRDVDGDLFEALVIDRLGRPDRAADPALLPVALPQVNGRAHSLEITADPDGDGEGRKAAPKVVDRVKAATVELVRAGAKPKPATVARIVGVDNSPHVSRTVRKAIEEGERVTRPETPPPPPRPSRQKREELRADDRDQHARTAPPEGAAVGDAGQQTSRPPVDGVATAAASDPGTQEQDG
jgi:hypothetical protein